MHYRPTENPALRLPLISERSGLMLQAMEEMDYDAANLGWLDPFLPARMLLGFDAGTSFPFLSANIRDDAGERPFAPWTIREYEGFRVGLFGLVSTRMPGVPGSSQRNFKISDHLLAAKEAIRELREKCDIVIALTSLGLADDEILARSVSGIDVILGGLDRRVLYQARTENGTIIVQAGSKGMRLGRLDLEFTAGQRGGWTQKKGPGGKRTFTWSLVSLAGTIPDEPRIADMLATYRETLKQKKIALQVSQPPQPTSPYVGAAVCRECHPDEFSEWVRGPHAGAFSTLVEKNQDGNPDCLRCHVTAFGIPGGYRPGGKPDLRAVQCEACHGPGRRHRASPSSAILIQSELSEDACRRCHNPENSPEFEFGAYLRKLSPHGVR